MTRAKVCGLGSREDLRAAVDAGADAVGVVASVPVDTPREVSVPDAADLLSTVPPFVTGVLVTMPDSADHAVDLVERVGPDAVQLHGDLGPQAVAGVAARTDVAVLKAVDADDPARAADFDDVADALLVDSASADGGGGTGETHDWARTREATADLDSPLVLAGGLTPDNVADAIAAVDPFAVDVASGVEASDGVKDHDAVRAFVDVATCGGSDSRTGDDAAGDEGDDAAGDEEVASA